MNEDETKQRDKGIGQILAKAINFAGSCRLFHLLEGYKTYEMSEHAKNAITALRNGIYDTPDLIFENDLRMIKDSVCNKPEVIRELNELGNGLEKSNHKYVNPEIGAMSNYSKFFKSYSKNEDGTQINSNNNCEVILIPRKKFNLKDSFLNKECKADFLYELALCTFSYDPKILLDMTYKPLGFEILKNEKDISENPLIDTDVYRGLREIDFKQELSYDPLSQFKDGLDVILRPDSAVTFHNDLLKRCYVLNSTDVSNYGVKNSNFLDNEAINLENRLKQNLKSFETYPGRFKTVKNVGDFPMKLTIMPYEPKERRIL